jgi:hypothetical protein
VGYTTLGSGAVAASTDGGASWRIEPLPTGESNLTVTSVSCPSAATCWAVGYSTVINGYTNPETGVILATADGGSVWKAETVPTGVWSLYGVSCPTVTGCIAVGETASGQSDAVATTDGGSTWTSQAFSLPDTANYLQAVSCSTSADCWAVGVNTSEGAVIVATTDGGSHWKLEPPPHGISGLSGLSGVSCPTSKDCWAVGYQVVAPNGVPEIVEVVAATTDGGARWSFQTLPSGEGYLFSVSCPTTTDCDASGMGSEGNGIIDATSDGGTTWTAPTVPEGTASLNGVSCASSSECWSDGTATSGAAIVLNAASAEATATAGRGSAAADSRGTGMIGEAP